MEYVSSLFNLYLFYNVDIKVTFQGNQLLISWNNIAVDYLLFIKISLCLNNQ